MGVALITGVTGQDGSYLSERLIAEGWTVHGLVRPGPREGEQEPDSAVVLHEGDLGDAAALRSLVTDVRPDVVFNLGGISSVARSWNEPELTARLSGEAVLTLLDAVWQAREQSGTDMRLVQASSSEIFGAATQNPQTEETPVRPVSPYGAAKAFAHHCVGVYRNRGLFASAAILYNHESPRRPTSFVSRKITQGVAEIAAGRRERLALGNLDAVRDWGWAPDYVDAMVRIASADSADDFVVASGEAHSVREFVAAAFAHVGLDWQDHVDLDPRFMRPSDAPEMRGDASKARRVLGWTPTVGFDGIVARMVDNDLELLA